MAYETVGGAVSLSERRGLFCRYGCGVSAIPKTDSSIDDLKAAIVVRDTHEAAEHGKVYAVFVPETSRFNSAFRKK